MTLRRSTLYSLALLLLVALLAACGNSGPTTTGSPAATPTTAPSSAVVSTASATVNGKTATILTNAQGMTLYYFTKDTSTTSACTAACLQNWPPLLFTGSGSPTSSTTLTGMLSVVTTPSGQQVAYQGHLLYTFAGDTAAGQTNGEGKLGVWFVATSDLSAAGSAVVSTASATVSGKKVTILTNTQGMTLYYFTNDTPTTSACTASCLQNWPPLLFSGSGSPSSSTTLTGMLSVVTTPSGQQVAYQGHLLYTFAGDTAAGQTNGEGKFGVWFVATSDLSAAGGSSGAATPTPTGTGY
jgi:predicted lipoprotein with Yx(FWY)xxD motif